MSRLGLFNRTLLVVLICVVVGGYQWLVSQAMATWPATEGVVTRSETRPYRLGDDLIVYLSLRYRYSVDGRTYTGDRVTASGAYGARFERLVVNDQGSALARWWWRNFPQPAGNSHDDLLPAAARYPPGAKVSVYYDPDHPDRAVLDRSTDFRFFVLAVALIFLALLFAPLVWIYRKVTETLSADRQLANSLATRWQRFLGLMGIFGLLLMVWSFVQARKAAQPPPEEALASLCTKATRSMESRWAAVPLEPSFDPAWRETGLDEPRFAACPSEEPVSLRAPFSRDRLEALVGCRVTVADPPVAAFARLDFGSHGTVGHWTDERYQHALGVAGDDTGLWLLSHELGALRPQRQDRTWTGRLIPVAGLPVNRWRYERNWTALGQALSQYPYVLLSDRATPVGLRMLGSYGSCAVATAEEYPVGGPVWVRARYNTGDWPSERYAAGRPLLLAIHTPPQYQRERTEGWRLLQGFAGGLAILGLVPLLVGWISRLYGRPLW
ncbi:MAG: DUF3592 domain-containing protein [Xanthomonadales bacterium]|nr:DUF3592 domain-containing protein [Xanthomonadales bacterium]